jgi:hypothetical protein
MQARPSDVAHLTVGQMMRTKNFGTRSMVDLLQSFDRIASCPVFDSDIRMSPSAETLEPLSSNLTWAADRLSASRTGRRIRANDPRMRNLVRELLYTANNSSNEPPLGSAATLTEIARRLAVRTRDPLSPSETVNLIDQIRLGLSGLIRMTLEDELQSLAAQHVSGRNLDLMLILLGWNGDLPKTLQAVGDLFGITRERVRQIQSQFLYKVRRTKAFIPILERVRRFLANRVPAVANDIEEELCASLLYA